MNNQQVKYILIIGGSSFIAKNLLDYFNSYFTENFNYIFILTFHKNQNHLNFKSNIKFNYEFMDLSDKESIENIFTKYEIDFILHLASNNFPITSNNNIINDLNFSISSLLNILDLSVKYNIKCLYFFSTGGGFEYPKIDNAMFQEEIYLKHNSSYSIIKQTMENYILLYHNKYNI